MELRECSERKNIRAEAGVRVESKDFANRMLRHSFLLITRATLAFSHHCKPVLQRPVAPRSGHATTLNAT